MIRVVIADDHAVVRAGVKQILADASGVSVVGEASSGNEALELVRKTPCDVLILDISMPGRGGMETLKQLRSESSDLPVLFLTMHAEEQYAVRAIKAGAAGYMTKDSIADDLVNAVRKVSAGKKYITASVAERLAEEIGMDAEKTPHERLSDREYQIFIMIASGKTVSEIGKELSLSVKTISTYRARILEKTGLRNNAEITHYAFQEKLVGG